MNKTLVASAVALGMGTASTASALTMNMTMIRFNGTQTTTGTLNSTGGGSYTNFPNTFFGTAWTADGAAFFSAGAGASTWAGTSPNGAYSYTFNLSANQVAWGVDFDWNTNLDIPVLNIMTCTGLTTGSACTGTATAMQTPPFAGQAPAFDGTISSSSAAVPVPAAVWLMGSGLVGLAGVARRRKKA